MTFLVDPAGVARGVGLAEQYVSTPIVIGLPEIEANTQALIASLKVRGLSAEATLVERALINLWKQLEEISVLFAKRSQQAVIDEEQTTRVRPDSGDPKGQMRDYLRCGLIPGVPGAFGFVDQDYLANSPVFWWWTQEIGYSGNVGKELHGWFFDSGFTNPTYPNPEQSREHPLFGSTGDTGPPMTILNPIEERRFALHALEKIQGEWEGAVLRAAAQFELERDAALAAAAAQIVAIP